MRALGPILLLGGYLLVYASVANGGLFATDPWAGLYADAYNLDAAAATAVGVAATSGAAAARSSAQQSINSAASRVVGAIQSVVTVAG